MKKMVGNVKMYWYKKHMHTLRKKVNQMVQEGTSLTSFDLLWVTKKMDRYCVKYLQVQRSIR